MAKFFIDFGILLDKKNCENTGNSMVFSRNAFDNFEKQANPLFKNII